MTIEQAIKTVESIINSNNSHIIKPIVLEKNKTKANIIYTKNANPINEPKIIYIHLLIIS